MPTNVPRKRISRTRPRQEALGFAVARLSRPRAAHEPLRHGAAGRLRRASDPLMPVIAAMWHGQHFMIHFAKRAAGPRREPGVALGDGELNAIALRISGSRDPRLGRARHETSATRAASRPSRACCGRWPTARWWCLTADVPKISRVCGTGIVTLAQLSGRPIVPDRRGDEPAHRFHKLGPGEPRPAVRPRRHGARRPGSCRARGGRRSPRAARRAIEVELDRVHERAYALVGSRDPGASRAAGPRAGSEARAR